jgi:hypothetical protein
MNLKKVLYLTLSIILGLILSFLIHGIIEISYINYSLSRGVILKPSALTSKCYLPSLLQIFLIFAGLFGGYILGQKWWTKIYGKK